MKIMSWKSSNLTKGWLEYIQIWIAFIIFGWLNPEIVGYAGVVVPGKIEENTDINVEKICSKYFCFSVIQGTLSSDQSPEVNIQW